MSVWAFSDIHGNRKLFDAIKNFIKEDDIVYFLGDACDRGPDGWEIIKEILADERFIYLKGNHEDMLVKAYFEQMEGDYSNHREMDLWFWNGGQPTSNVMGCDKVKEVINTVNKLALLPLTAEYINKNGELIHMSHAGWSMGLETPTPEEWIWDRTHFLDTRWFGPDNAIVIHGHTPIPHLVEELSFFYEGLAEEELEPGALWYCGGHKICIDCGAHFTGVTTLINLDTFDEEIFEIE